MVQKHSQRTSIQKPQSLLRLLLLLQICSLSFTWGGVVIALASAQSSSDSLDTQNSQSGAIARSGPKALGENHSEATGQQSSDTAGYSQQSIVNWVSQALEIKLVVPIDRWGLQTRYLVSSIVESNCSVWLHAAVKNLQINSQQTLLDFWGNDSFKDPYTFLKNVLKKKYAAFGVDLKSFRSVYTINLYPDISRIWVNDEFEQEELAPAILDKNAVQFTGLIIYVENQLPVRGEPFRVENLKPALFPRIYNENLKLIMGYRNVEKDALLTNGMLSYDRGSSHNNHQSLVGSYPLRIIAQELFGTARTDVIISNTDADSILENSYLRAALQKGRVLILSESVSRGLADDDDGQDAKH